MSYRALSALHILWKRFLIIYHLGYYSLTMIYYQNTFQKNCVKKKAFALKRSPYKETLLVVLLFMLFFFKRKFINHHTNKHGRKNLKFIIIVPSFTISTIPNWSTNCFFFLSIISHTCCETLTSNPVHLICFHWRKPQNIDAANQQICYQWSFYSLKLH